MSGMYDRRSAIDKLKDKLENLEVAPPGDMWSRIEEELPDTSTRTEDRRHSFLAAIILIPIIITLAGGVWVYTQFPQNSQEAGNSAPEIISAIVPPTPPQIQPKKSILR